MAAQNLVLDNLVLDNQADMVTVRFAVHVDEVDEVRRELASGSELGLTCVAELISRGGFILDETVAEREYVSVIRYDSLAEEYVLDVPGRDPMRSADLGKLLARGWGGLSMDLGPWNLLKRGREYSLDFEVRLARRDVPRWLKTALFFWSWDVIGATTYRLDFSF
ncbi:DUF4390 domain-containing protein [Desulfohalovibrio reitneri]|uniref:DUF4390 domain-containing protein n=1 Tax=Desulfohalovibrio reitneri TaxID=1307759 RepID=UPI000B0BD515|nr:DUF4390 domain-containing protein [Desulfohalovibrio reitneri]